MIREPRGLIPKPILPREGCQIGGKSVRVFGFLCEADGRKTGSKTGSIGSTGLIFMIASCFIHRWTFEVSDPRKPLTRLQKKAPTVRAGLGGQYWTRTSDLYHVKVAL